MDFRDWSSHLLLRPVIWVLSLRFPVPNEGKTIGGKTITVCPLFHSEHYFDDTTSIFLSLIFLSLLLFKLFAQTRIIQ